MYYMGVRFVGQAVKTPPSHGGNTGSIPVRTAPMGNTYPSISLFLLSVNDLLSDQLHIVAQLSRQKSKIFIMN